MYFWKIDKLKNDLLKKSLSESESFKYLFATIVVHSFVVIPFSFEENIFDTYTAIINALITTIGTYYVYRCNKGKNGHNFLQKYFSLDWVFGIRWFVFMLPIIILFRLTTNLPAYTTLADVIFLNLSNIPYFWFLGKHIKEVS